VEYEYPGHCRIPGKTRKIEPDRWIEDRVSGIRCHPLMQPHVSKTGAKATSLADLIGTIPYPELE